MLTSEQADATSERADSMVAPAASQLVAWLSLAAVNSIAIEAILRWVPWRRRLGLHAANWGQLLAIGCGVAAAVQLAKRRSRAPTWLPLGVLTVFSVALGTAMLPADFRRLVARVFGGSEAILFALSIGFALTLPAAAWLGTTLSRSRWRWLVVAVALAASLLNNFVLHAGYVSIHAFVLLCAAALCGNALAATVPAFGWLKRQRAKRLIQLSALGLGATMVYGSGDARLVPLTNLGGAPQMKWILRLRHAFAKHAGARKVTPKLALKHDEKAWFRSREGVAAIAASQPAMLPADAVVLLITIDAFRNDLMASPSVAKQLSFFRALDRTATRFERTWSAAPGTAESLTSLFASKVASQILWKRRVILRPHRDTSQRFPALLSAAGVQTFHLAPLYPLTNAFGIVRGFQVEVDLESAKPKGQHFVLSKTQLPALKQHLLQHPNGRHFIYLHLLDPHAPYDDADERKASSSFNNYVQELERVGQRLAELDRWLVRKGFGNRLTLIVSADHGESFGEHGTKYHASTMYEEQLRVPLWIRLPNKKARQIQEPVSLLDLGPTILDLMGVATPGNFMGQSLVPYLRGHSPSRSRPIVADNRRKRAMVVAGRYKVIRDMRLGTCEIYDLERDPKELINIADGPQGGLAHRLDHFFSAHQHKAYRDGPPLGP